MANVITHRVMPTFYRESEGATIFNSQVEEFLDTASSVAHRVLGHKSGSDHTPSGAVAPSPSNGGSSGGNVSNIHIGDTNQGVFVNSGNRNTTVVDRGSGAPSTRKKKEGMDGGTRVLAGLVAAVVGIAALFIAGKTISSRRETKKDLEELNEFEKQLSGYQVNYPGNAHLNKMEKIAKIQKSILTEKKDSKFWKIAIVVGIVAAAALGFAGALVNIQALVLGGVALGVVALGALAFKYGLEWYNSRREAKDLLKNVRELKAADEVIMHDATYVYPDGQQPQPFAPQPGGYQVGPRVQSQPQSFAPQPGGYGMQPQPFAPQPGGYGQNMPFFPQQV